MPKRSQPAEFGVVYFFGAVHVGILSIPPFSQANLQISTCKLACSNFTHLALFNQGILCVCAKFATFPLLGIHLKATDRVVGCTSNPSHSTQRCSGLRCTLFYSCRIDYTGCSSPVSVEFPAALLGWRIFSRLTSSTAVQNIVNPRGEHFSSYSCTSSFGCYKLVFTCVCYNVLADHAFIIACWR